MSIAPLTFFCSPFSQNSFFLASRKKNILRSMILLPLTIYFCGFVFVKLFCFLDSIFKSRDITLPTWFRLVKAMVFLMVMYACRSWTVKKAERRRIDAFELWCWRRLLRVPWSARRSNKSILKEISPGIFFGRSDAKAETPLLWPPHVKS